MSQRSAGAQGERPPEPASEHTDPRTLQVLSGVTALLGAIIIAVPFLFVATETAVWNNVIVGAAILILAGFNFWRLSANRASYAGVAALVTLLGIWALIAPFIIEMGSEALLWTTAIAGILVAAMAGYHTYTVQRKERAAARAEV